MCTLKLKTCDKALERRQGFYKGYLISTSHSAHIGPPYNLISTFSRVDSQAGRWTVDTNMHGRVLGPGIFTNKYVVKNT